MSSVSIDIDLKEKNKETGKSHEVLLKAAQHSRYLELSRRTSVDIFHLPLQYGECEEAETAIGTGYQYLSRVPAAYSYSHGDGSKHLTMSWNEGEKQAWRGLVFYDSEKKHRNYVMETIM